MNPQRLFKHLSTPRWWALRAFRRADLVAIAEAVTATETRHRGELRVAIEGPLPLRALWRDLPPRERAAQLFTQLGVDRTAEASGILIYVQLVDRRVEILADRGIAERVPQAEWDAICRGMESAFRAGQWREGALAAVARAGELLTTHFPAGDANPNELPDAPVVL